MMAQWRDRIMKIAALRGVAGREHRAAESLCEMLKPFAPDAVCRDGSVIGHIGDFADHSKPRLMLCAHLDQVGFFVTDITDDGFVRIGAVGGIDRRLLAGQPVILCTQSGEELFGVISILPPHLTKGDSTVPEWEQFCVDFGFASADAAKEKITLGDAVYFAHQPMQLLHDRITAPALDNRCGVVAVLGAAEQIAALPKDALPCAVTVVFSAQEERGSRGARIAATEEQPDIAIAVDVTFAMSHGEKPYGCMTLGKGPAIGISSTLDEALSQALICTAVAVGIPYQKEIMPDGTGTDADLLALAPGGAAAATVSIPLQYMHTPVEIIDCGDVAQTAALLAAFAGRCRDL